MRVSPRTSTKFYRLLPPPPVEVFVLEDVRHVVGPKIAGLGDTDECWRWELNLGVEVQFGICVVDSSVYILCGIAGNSGAAQVGEGKLGWDVLCDNNRQYHLQLLKAVVPVLARRSGSRDFTGMPASTLPGWTDAPGAFGADAHGTSLTDRASSLMGGDSGLPAGSSRALLRQYGTMGGPLLSLGPCLGSNSDGRLEKEPPEKELEAEYCAL